MCPSLREYTARWGVTPERLRPGQKVMHPGPMNRGVEIDPLVADAADALIETQVRAGLVVRMAVLYDLLTTRARAGRGRGPDGGGVMLYRQGRTEENLVVRGARVLDPVEGVDAQVDVRIDDGVIAEIGSTSTRTRTASSKAPGSCWRRRSSTRTCISARRAARTRRRSPRARAAAAAGGYCAILAMPNTEPVVDSAAVLGALIEQARDGRRGAGRVPGRHLQGPGRAPS